jgi:hypothetical protein
MMFAQSAKVDIIQTILFTILHFILLNI